MNQLTSTFVLVIESVGGLYVVAILLRLLLQMVKADFYNPISKAIFRVTEPTLKYFRMFFPRAYRANIPVFLFAFLVQIIIVSSVLMVKGFFPNEVTIVNILLVTLYNLLISLLNIYFYGLIIVAIASWIAPSSYNPGLVILHQLTEPLCSRARKIIPSFGGIDLSLMAVMLVIVVIKNLLPTILSTIGQLINMLT